VLLLLVLLCGGCREQGERHRCSCAFLTDFDDGSRREVTVCSPTAERAPAVARGCAQSGAPATIQDCTCTSLGGRCAVGACDVE
jgi:hypothetical protein